MATLLIERRLGSLVTARQTFGISRQNSERAEGICVIAMRRVPPFVKIRLRRKIVHASSSIRSYRELGRCVFVLRTP